MLATKIHIFLAILTIPNLILGNDLILQSDEDKILQFLMDIVNIGKEKNDWKNVLVGGILSDSLIKQLQDIPSTLAVITEGEDDVEIEDVVPYAPHTAIFKCRDFNQLEELFMKTLASPYWHPLTNVILLYESQLTNFMVAKIFFSLLYYKTCNVIILQFEDLNKTLYVTHYNPYISGKDLQNFGCRTARKLGITPSNFDEGFVCEEGCQNVTQHSKFRANNLGTCIGFQTDVILYKDRKLLYDLKLFEYLGKDLHGFSLRAYTSEVKPFLVIDVFDNGTYALGSRDGNLWNTMSKAMNFSIDLSPSADTMKISFSFERTIQQIYGFSHRKADLFLIPIYQFDLIIVDLDYTFPVKESGLCLMGHRAGFETSLFDAKQLEKNYELLIEFVICLLCIWLVFFLFNAREKGKVSLDQAGKDLVNVFRTTLSITLYKAPKSRAFRFYLATSIWCFFVLNFFTQAAIISFFSSFRRGKEIDTFEDVIEKGYPIEGLASPDSFLPETEERFNKLNSRLVGIQSLFECAENLIKDSHRFCLIDCSVGRYLERNKLNDKGQQYLHIAKADRFHSHYLNMIFPRHSPLTKQYNKIVMSLFEAGLIKKWEEYRFTDIKQEAQVKPLALEDLLGIFKCYGLSVCLCLIVFFVELTLGFLNFLKQRLPEKITKWKRTRIAKNKVRLEKKKGKIIQTHSYTQT